MAKAPNIPQAQRHLPAILMSAMSIFRNNLIERGGATNAAQAIVVSGQFKLTGNNIVGFEGKEPTPKPESKP